MTLAHSVGYLFPLFDVVIKRITSNTSKWISVVPDNVVYSWSKLIGALFGYSVLSYEADLGV